MTFFEKYGKLEVKVVLRLRSATKVKVKAMS